MISCHTNSFIAFAFNVGFETSWFLTPTLIELRKKKNMYR